VTRRHLGSTLFLCLTASCAAQTFRPDIPKAWDDKEVERFELPLAQRDRSPRYMSAEQYYRLKVRPIYRSYPAYAEGREPAGYRDSLRQKEPEIIPWDSSKLQTKNDWIAAGKLIFENDNSFSPAPARPTLPEGRLSPEGILPFYNPGGRYYIRQKGLVEIGRNSCASCHMRVLPDGSLLSGAQLGPEGVTPVTERVRAVRNSTPEEFRRMQEVYWVTFGIPWVLSKEEYFARLTKDAYIQNLTAPQAGMVRRQGTSASHPPHIPSLIGVQDLRYLDATGLVRHRSIGDLMRYAIINLGLDTMAHFGDFQPTAGRTSFSAEEGTRLSDEQLYALVLYIYSLKPPTNPNPFDDSARRGKAIFERQGCVGCHTPPLYTNNKLTPATGFRVPDDLLKTENILNVSVGTDPTLALQTRRGTGFYKVPSLRGVWYRNAFGHGGWADTLEEWLDPARLNQDYVPKGFHIAPGPVKGHEFGLKLPMQERRDLIAFLKTL
jgi:hypothetical protein